MMEGLLQGKVCIVTGGTRGIGRAITTSFAQQGATVIATCTGLVAYDDFDSSGGDVRVLVSNVADSAAVKKLIMEIRHDYGALDIVANNAGIESNELVGMIDEKRMRRMFEVNTFGTILMTQYASRLMRQFKSGGSIINIASGVALRGNAGQSVYSATKGAVISFTKSAAKELTQYGIRVNAVAPGLTDTGMLANTREEVLDGRVKRIAAGRPAASREIADACLYLASDMSSYVSGHVLVVDGCAVM